MRYRWELLTSDLAARIQPVIGARRSKLSFAAAVAAVAVWSGVSEAAGPNGSASAGGVAATLPSGAQGTASATSDRQPQASGQAGGLSDLAGSVASSSVNLSASNIGAQATAEATANASGISLIGGRIQIGSLNMTIGATAGPGASSAGTTSARAEGVSVDGVAVSTTPGSRVEVPGAGTLTFFEQVADGNGAVRANAARFEVTVEGTGLPVGSQIVIGHIEAAAAPGEAAPAPAAPTTTAPAAPPAVRSAPAGPAAAPDPTLKRPIPKPPTRETPDEQARPGGPRTGALPSARVLPAPEPIVIPDLTPLPEIPAPRLPAPAVSVSPNADGYVFPVFGEVTFGNDYGAPRAVTGWHHGNDIFGAQGLPILAVADGVLSKVGVNSLGGNRLWLTDRYGNAYYYAHLSGYAQGVAEGGRVKAGEVIGFLGNTGQAITTPPHLHFEIHPAGADSIDPFAYLSAWKQRSSLPLAIPEASISASTVPVSGSLIVSFRQASDQPVGPGDGNALVVG